MASSARELADLVARLGARIDALERGSQLNNSTVETASGESVSVLKSTEVAVEVAAVIPGLQDDLDTASVEVSAAGEAADEAAEVGMQAGEDGLAAADDVMASLELVDFRAIEAEAAAADAAGQAADAAGQAAAAEATADAAATAAQVAKDVAVQAQSDASAAQTAANGKNKVTYSTAAATAETPGSTAGDVWFQTGAGGVITAQWQWTGSAWETRTLASAIIAALDAGKITTGTLSADRIGAATITTAKLAALAVTAEKISAGAVTAAKIAAGTITASEIAAGTITGSKIATGTIVAGNIGANQVNAEHLAADSVLAASIKAGEVTTAKLAASAVTAEKIQAATITGDKLQASTVTAREIKAASITADLLSADAINGKTITGATIRSAATGQRTEIITNQMRFFASNNANAGAIYGIANGASGAAVVIGSDLASITVGSLAMPRGGSASLTVDTAYIPTLYVGAIYDEVTRAPLGGQSVIPAVQVGSLGNQTIPNATNTILAVALSYQNGGVTKSSSGAGHQWVLPEAGFYVCAISLDWATASGGGREVAVVVAGTNVSRINIPVTSSASTPLSAVVYINAGDTVRFQAFQNRTDTSGASLIASIRSASIRYLGA